MPVQIHSLNMNNVLFNPIYLSSSHHEMAIIESNGLLISTLKQQIKNGDYEKVIFMQSPDKQSILADNYSQKDDFSSFIELYRLQQYIKRWIVPTECTMDDYLLADTYGKKPIGENYQMALKNSSDYLYSPCLEDNSQLTVLYSQMHRMASLYKNEKIEFNFYGNELSYTKTLEKLVSFFMCHVDLIPINTTLKFYHYTGLEIRLLKNIQGMGVIDEYYEHSLLSIIAYGKLLLPEAFKKSHHVIDLLLKNNAVASFKENKSLVVAENNSCYIPSSFFYPKYDNPTHVLFKHIINIAKNEDENEINILKNKKININIKHNETTPIEQLAVEKNHKAVHFLIKNGVNAKYAAAGYNKEELLNSQSHVDIILAHMPSDEVKNQLTLAFNKLNENNKDIFSRKKENKFLSVHIANITFGYQSRFIEKTQYHNVGIFADEKLANQIKLSLTATASGNPWPSEKLLSFKEKKYHFYIPGQKNPVIYNENPDVILIIAHTRDEVIKQYAKTLQYQLKSTRVKYLFLAIHPDATKDSIHHVETVLKWPLINLSNEDLFVEPRHGNEHFLRSTQNYIENTMGKGMHHVLNYLDEYFTVTHQLDEARENNHKISMRR